MSRKRVVPKQQRRYSLPATTSQMPALLNFRIPEGSDIFQKALEDLSKHEPNHALSKNTANTFGEFGFNGLNNIQELDESAVIESEDEVNNAADDESQEREHSGRRHSTPSCFPRRSNSETSGTRTEIKAENTKTAVKQFAKVRRDYFIKHGRWPVSNSLKAREKTRSSQIM